MPERISDMASRIKKVEGPWFKLGYPRVSMEKIQYNRMLIGYLHTGILFVSLDEQKRDSIRLVYLTLSFSIHETSHKRGTESSDWPFNCQLSQISTK